MGLLYGHNMSQLTWVTAGYNHHQKHHTAVTAVDLRCRRDPNRSGNSGDFASRNGCVVGQDRDISNKQWGCKLLGAAVARNSRNSVSHPMQ